MTQAYSNRYAGLPVTEETNPKLATSLNFPETESPQINVLATTEYMPFSVVLDSGAADHVVSSSEAPGYQISESPGSKAGACFIAANGERISIGDR